MADANTSGLDALTQRMNRARRTVPSPRRTAEAIAQPAGIAQPAAAAAAPAIAEAPVVEPGGEPPAAPPVVPPTAAPPLGDEPLANLMVRVRRSLDLRLDHVIHELRRHGNVRTNKTELVEMLLWELPEEPDTGLAERLGRYRQAVPRR